MEINEIIQDIENVKRQLLRLINEITDLQRDIESQNNSVPPLDVIKSCLENYIAKGGKNGSTSV